MGELTRRELLTAFLGAPLALAACRRAPPFLPDGVLVGASHARGHRLRGDERPTPNAFREVPILVVGAGVAGLAAAWRLRAAGVEDVTVLELEDAVGGTARSGVAAGLGYPWGAHYIAAPTAENRLLVRLLDEMGVLAGQDANGEPVIDEAQLVHDPEERVFYKGRWYEGLYLHAGASAEDSHELARFEKEIARWVAFRDARGRRAFTLPVALCSDDAEVTALDKISMEAWLEAQGLRSPRLRWLVDYACRDDYGAAPADTSAWAGLFYFASRVPKSGADSQPLVTWPEGNGRIVAHLGARAHVVRGQCVVDIEPRAESVDVTALDRAGAPVGWRAQQVIFCAPRFVATRVVRPWRSAPPAPLFTYGAWMVANLHVRARPRGRGFPLAWDNVLYESPSLGYVDASHQLSGEHGSTVLTYYYPLCDSDPRAARQRLLDGDREAWADVALSDLARAHPEIRELCTRLDVMRWGHAMVRPSLGLFSSKERQAAAAPFGRVHFAHTELSGVALFEEALYHGCRAAEEVLAVRGVRTRSLL